MASSDPRLPSPVVSSSHDLPRLISTPAPLIVLFHSCSLYSILSQLQGPGQMRLIVFMLSQGGLQRHLIGRSAGKIVDYSTTDQYQKNKEDVKLMHEMGLDAYRFSISWSRLIPDGRGPMNPKGLEYYNNLINEVLSYSTILLGHYPNLFKTKFVEIRPSLWLRSSFIFEILQEQLQSTYNLLPNCFGNNEKMGLEE